MAKKTKIKSKKKRFLIFGLIFLIVIGAGVYFFTACNEKPALKKLSGSKNFMCDLSGMPEEHSGLDNVGAIIYTLSQRDFYSTEAYTKVNAAAGVKQYIKGGKDYKDGIMIASTFSWSEASGFAAGFVPDDVSMQKFYGEDKAVIRKGAVTPNAWKEDTWDRTGFAWNTGDPFEVLSEEEYENVYGIWGTEFCDYILNEKTCTEISDLSKEGEIYSLTIKLDPKSSVEYYIRQMVTMGGLSDAPDFSSVTMTLYFTQDWSIQRIFVEEKYSTKKIGISAACSGTTEIVFSYDEADVDVSAYEAYFKNYAKAEFTGTSDPEKSGLDYILAGISPLLYSPTCMKVNADIGGEELTGDIYLSLAGLDIAGIAAGGNVDPIEILSSIKVRAKFGGLLLSLENGTAYINYKDLNGKLAITDLLAMLPESTQEGNSTGKETGLLFSVDESWDQNLSFIPATIKVGDVEIHIGFSFTGEGLNYRWSKIEVSLEGVGTKLELSVTPSENGNVPAVDSEKAVDLAPFISEIAQFVTSGRYGLDFNYALESKGLFIDGSAILEIRDGLKIQGELNVSVQGTEIPLQITYAEEQIWLKAGNLAVTSKIEKEDIGQVISLFGNDKEGNAGLQLPEIIRMILGVDYDRLFKDLTLSNERLSLTADGETLKETLAGILGEASNLFQGDITISFDLTEKEFAAFAMGANISASASDREVVKPQSSEYVEIDIINALKSGIAFVKNILNGETGVAGEIAFGENKAEILALLRMQDGSFVNLQGKIGGLDILAEADGICIRYKDFLGRLPYEGIMPDMNVMFDLDISAILGSILDSTLVKEENKYTLSGSLALGETKLPFAINFVQTQEETNLQSVLIATELFGESAKIQLTFGEIEGMPEFSGQNAVDLLPFIHQIRDLIAGRKYSMSFSYIDPQNYIDISGTIALDLSLENFVKVQGTLEAKIGALNVPVEFTVFGNEIYLSVCGMKVKTTKEEAKALLEKLLKDIELPTMPAEKLAVSDIISSLFSLHYDEIIAGLSLTSEELSLQIDVDALLEGIGQSVGTDDFSVGMVSAVLNNQTGIFTISALGATIDFAMSSAEINEPVDFSETKDIAFTLGGEIVLRDEQLLPEAENNELVLSVEIQGEVWFAEGLQILLNIKINDFSDVNVLYCDGNIKFAYGAHWMEVPLDQWQTVVEKFSALRGNASKDVSIETMLALFGEGGLDLYSVLKGIEISVGAGGLGVVADLAALLGNGAGKANFELSTNDKGLLIQADSIFLCGVTINDLNAGIYAAGNEYSFPNLKSTDQCKNVFEFILNSYGEFAKTSYLGLSFEYASAETDINLDGKIQFVQEETGTKVQLNLDCAVSILNYELDADGNPVLESGIKKISGGHYLHLSVVGSKLYFTYSIKAMDAPTALRVTMPVSDLFDAGETILPILSPLLGIEETVYYYDFVVKILSGGYTDINSGIFSEMDTEEWCDLILGIIHEYAPSEGEDISSKEPANIVLKKDENGNLVVSVSNLTDGKGDMKITLTTLKEEISIAEPSDASQYINVSSIASLLQDVLQAYEYRDTGYHLTGFIRGSISIWDIANINLDLRVGVESDNSAYIYLSLSIPEMLGITNGNTRTDIIIKDGYVYINRFMSSYYHIAFPVWKGCDYRDYRAMTLNYFFEDILNQIVFIFNFSSAVSNKILENNVTEINADAGEMVTLYEATDAKYQLNLNLGALAGTSLLGNISINIDRSFRENTVDQQGNQKAVYDLVKLHGDTTLLGIADMYYELNHITPGSQVDFGVMNEGIKTAFEAYGCLDESSMQTKIAENGIITYTNH